MSIPTLRSGAASSPVWGFYALGSDRPVLLHTASWATAETTNEALRKLREQHPERRIIVIWDNVRYHHSRLVHAPRDRDRSFRRIVTAHSAAS